MIAAADRSDCRRELVWFLLLTWIPTSILAAVAATRGGLASFPAMPLAMLTPMIAAFLVQRLIIKRPAARALGFRIGRLRCWVAAPAAMLVLWLVVFTISRLVHPAAYAPWDVVAARVLRLKNLPPMSVGAGSRLGVAYLLTVIVAPVLNLPIFLGEEVGWRAFMTPRLVAIFGRPGLLIGGAIWAVWHTPFIFMGLDYPMHPLAGHLIWIPYCAAFGILLQTIYVRSGSIFPAALCHGLTNQFVGLTMGLVVVDARFRDLLDGPAGLIGLVIITLPAVYCYRRYPLSNQLPAQLSGRPRS